MNYLTEKEALELISGTLSKYFGVSVDYIIGNSDK